MTTVIRDSKSASEETYVAALEQKPTPLAIKETAMPGHISRQYTLGELCHQAILKSLLSTSLPKHDKKSCAWDLQLQKDVAGLLSLYELGKFKPFSCKQPDEREPRMPATYNPTANWTHPCVMGSKCRKPHSPANRAEFKRLAPEARLAHIMALGLCQLCYPHTDTRRCWSLGKVP
jgi:hypothetical protein